MTKHVYTLKEFIDDSPEVSKELTRRAKLHYERRPFNGDSEEIVYVHRASGLCMPFTAGMRWLYALIDESFSEQITRRTGFKQSETEVNPVGMTFRGEALEMGFEVEPEKGKKILRVELYAADMGRNLGDWALKETKLVTRGIPDKVSQVSKKIKELPGNKLKDPESVLKQWNKFPKSRAFPLDYLGDWFKPDSELEPLPEISEEEAQNRWTAKSIHDRFETIAGHLHGLKWDGYTLGQRIVEAYKDNIIGSRDPKYDGEWKKDVTGFFASFNAILPKNLRFGQRQIDFVLTEPPTRDVTPADYIGAMLQVGPMYSVPGMDEMEKIGEERHQETAKE